MNSTKIETFLFFLIIHVSFLLHASSTAFGSNDTDRLSLLAIKSKLLVDPLGVTSSWNDSFHFCQWQGVTCGLRHRRVTVLDLSSRGLVGSLSPHVGNLSFLREIRLENNTFGGKIPHEVGRLFRLQVLQLHNNSFDGEIPTKISNCANLTTLALGHNKLAGKIPEEFSSLFKLKVLYLRDNALSGNFPTFIGNLTSLEIIGLSSCQLQGSIPNVFDNLRSLKTLAFNENHFIGTVPSSIYNLSLLEILFFSGNQLNGTLPASLSLMLPHLKVLIMSSNLFTGSLPPSISNCSELGILDVASNNFYGKVTINFGNLQNLRHVYLGSNNLGSGEDDELKFLDFLSNCSNLERVDIYNNRFRGMLPNPLGNFSSQFSSLAISKNSLYGSIHSLVGSISSITLLHLEENQFTGTIPFAIGNLKKLQIWHLHRNNFFGNIPESIGNLSLLIQLGMAFNKLDGTIPSSLGNCHNLQFLSLYQNNISGIIPRQIFQLSSLSIVLDLGGNHLSGPLPNDVGNLKNLGQLSLDDNDLSGELPSSFGSCTNLEIIYLSNNFFQGSIPTSLGSLRALRVLNLSHNNFSGPIPNFFEQKSLENLDISFNDFEGELPQVGVFANSSEISVVGNKKLCGGISKLQLRKCSLKDPKGRRKLSVVLKIVIPIASVLVVLAAVSIFFYFWHTKKRKNEPLGLELKEAFLKVSYEKLMKATNGFSSENLIGVGAFASVYKGVFNEDGNVVAVKVLNLQNRRGFKSFITECEALRHVRHRNLVKVITSCSSIDFQGNDFKALVYEYMPNGTLEQWLHSSSRTGDEFPHLTLLQRLSIAIDVACALDYLHHHSGTPIIHCDLKPSNILLDSDMVAHVGDFGIAKFLLPELSDANPSSTTGIRGTIGYAPPEYGLGNDVSKSGDVYSYGIVMLEMVTGRKPTDALFQEGLNLHKWVSMALANGEMEIVEPKLLNGNNRECMISMLKIGVACSLESPQDRMDINRVIHELPLLRGTIV